MGVNLLNHQSTYEFTLSNSSDSSYGCTLGKRKCFSYSTIQPPTKERRISVALRTDDGDWRILLSGAKQPNLDVVQSRNGKVSLPSLPLMPPAKPKVYRTFGIKEGEGNYGFVFSVTDPEFPEKELVMKISIANANFFAEVSALRALNIKKQTPNVPHLHNWFISDQLPPNCRHWRGIAEKIRTSPQFKKSNKFPIGYLILEKANAGSLASFHQNHISTAESQDEIWKLIDCTLFQLLFTAAALPESSVIHRDIGGSNIMLTSVANDRSKWWFFKVGKQLFRFNKPSIKPLLIDYGSAHLLEFGCSLKTDFRYTTLRYRAPEMIFLSSSPSGTLQPEFTPATDLFSIAMSVIEMVVGNFSHQKSMRHQFSNHPFLQHNPPLQLSIRLKKLSEKLRADENDMSLNYSQRMWAGTLYSGFLTTDESLHLARYLWGMYMELGIPNNRIWPGVEETDVWSIMDGVIKNQKEKNLPCPTESGLLLSNSNSKLRQYLSEHQVSCLLSMLRYNPKHRPSPAALLKSEIFDEFRVDNKTPTQSPCWRVSGSPLSSSQF